MDPKVVEMFTWLSCQFKKARAIDGGLIKTYFQEHFYVGNRLMGSIDGYEKKYFHGIELNTDRARFLPIPKLAVGDVIFSSFQGKGRYRVYNKTIFEIVCAVENNYYLTKRIISEGLEPTTKEIEKARQNLQSTP